MYLKVSRHNTAECFNGGPFNVSFHIEMRERVCVCVFRVLVSVRVCTMCRLTWVSTQ